MTRAVMEKYITKENRRDLSVEPLKIRKEALWNQNSSRVIAAENNGAYLVNAGPLTALAAIESV